MIIDGGKRRMKMVVSESRSAPKTVMRQSQNKYCYFVLNVLMSCTKTYFLVTRLYEKKVGTKWDKICTTRISIFRIPPGDPCVFIFFHA